MTNEEAIFCEKSYIGETNCTDCKYYIADTCLSRESHKMAIKALEQQDEIMQILDDCDLEAWEVLEKIKEVVKAMTREKAINLVMKVFDTLEGECNIEYDWREEHEARDMAIKALEQDSVLDKIKADIVMYEADCRLVCDEEPCKQCTDNVFGSIYRTIDKYKAGSEETK